MGRQSICRTWPRFAWAPISAAVWRIGTAAARPSASAPAAPVSPATTAASVRRSRLHVALVIDRSGSMAGQPLAEAKRCAEFVVCGLAPTDAASLVVYDNTVGTLVPLTSAAERAPRTGRTLPSS